MDIAAWLRGLGMERYAAAFRDNEIDWEMLPPAHRPPAAPICSQQRTPRKWLIGPPEGITHCRIVRIADHPPLGGTGCVPTGTQRNRLRRKQKRDD
jgi:hypothetical protein